MKPKYIIAIVCIIFAVVYFQTRNQPSYNETTVSSELPAILETNSTDTIQYSEKTSYYDVDGDTENELRASINDNSPLCFGTDGYDACTAWYISWNVPGGSTSDSCLEEAAVSVDITFTYPRWLDAEQADTSLENKWNSYMTNVIKHETDHKNLVLKHVTDFKTELDNLANTNTCNDLQVIANEKGQEMLTTVQKVNDDYDLQTNHGKAQGAVFP